MFESLLSRTVLAGKSIMIVWIDRDFVPTRCIKMYLELREIRRLVYTGDRQQDNNTQTEWKRRVQHGADSRSDSVLGFLVENEKTATHPLPFAPSTVYRPDQVSITQVVLFLSFMWRYDHFPGYVARGYYSCMVVLPPWAIIVSEGNSSPSEIRSGHITLMNPPKLRACLISIEVVFKRTWPKLSSRSSQNIQSNNLDCLQHLPPKTIRTLPKKERHISKDLVDTKKTCPSGGDSSESNNTSAYANKAKVNLDYLRQTPKRRIEEKRGESETYPVVESEPNENEEKDAKYGEYGIARCEAARYKWFDLNRHAAGSETFETEKEKDEWWFVTSPKRGMDRLIVIGKGVKRSDDFGFKAHFRQFRAREQWDARPD
ncbi:hypothetical protein BT69DRAFT_1324197 [Atractiella rhizophila]|nr:hypothetical protein BT69DRAFT_1324197 [Atractiella rhizophila]